jgi:hypothetical protein
MELVYMCLSWCSFPNFWLLTVVRYLLLQNEQWLWFVNSILKNIGNQLLYWRHLSQVPNVASRWGNLTLIFPFKFCGLVGEGGKIWQLGFFHCKLFERGFFHCLLVGS